MMGRKGKERENIKVKLRMGMTGMVAPHKGWGIGEVSEQLEQVLVKVINSSA